MKKKKALKPRGIKKQFTLANLIEAWLFLQE